MIGQQMQIEKAGVAIWPRTKNAHMGYAIAGLIKIANTVANIAGTQKILALWR
jgi:hypothetical protein